LEKKIKNNLNQIIGESVNVRGVALGEIGAGQKEKETEDIEIQCSLPIREHIKLSSSYNSL